jgi:hypothetical protein
VVLTASRGTGHRVQRCARWASTRAAASWRDCTLEPREDTGQRRGVKVERRRQLSGGHPGHAAVYQQSQPLRPGQVQLGFHPFRDALQPVRNRPQALHELKNGVVPVCGPSVGSTCRHRKRSVSRPFGGTADESGADVWLLFADLARHWRHVETHGPAGALASMVAEQLGGRATEPTARATALHNATPLSNGASRNLLWGGSTFETTGDEPWRSIS